MNLLVIVGEPNLSRPTRLALCLLDSLHLKTLVDGGSLQDVSSRCLPADSVSVQALYGPAGPVLSGFTELREGTAAATNAKTLPAPRQLHCFPNKSYAVCVKRLQTQALTERIRQGQLWYTVPGSTVVTPLCPFTKDCQEPRLAVWSPSRTRQRLHSGHGPIFIYLSTHAILEWRKPI